MLQFIGKGAFSEVKLYQNNQTMKKYAIKIVDWKWVASNDYPNLIREILIHRALKHPNIVAMYDYFEDDDKIYLVTEYCENGNLFRHIHHKRTLPSHTI